MIQANELRIGNWVLFSPSGRKAAVKVRPVCVKELHQNTFIVKDKAFDLELFYESVGSQPIPLTPEILIAAGFDVDNDGFLKKKNIFYWLDIGVLQISVGYTPIINCPCKYVHQLQNLMFALTGSELEIVLNSKQNPERSVATFDASSNADGNQIEFPNIPLRIVEGL